MTEDAATNHTAEPAVVDWGDPDGAASPSRFGGGLAALRRDRRIPLTAAALAAVALVASLIGEWQLTTVTQNPSTADVGGESVQRFSAGVGGVGTWGTAYVLGIFLIVAGTAVVLFGPAAGRVQVRLAALGGCGTLVAVLAAAWGELGRRSAIFNGVFYGGGDDGPLFAVEHGRGISAALVGTLLFAATLLLAGNAAPAGGPAAAEEAPSEEEDPGRWPPRRSGSEDERPDGPIDLTVTPVTPFATPPDRRTQA